ATSRTFWIDMVVGALAVWVARLWGRSGDVGTGLRRHDVGLVHGDCNVHGVGRGVFVPGGDEGGLGVGGDVGVFGGAARLAVGAVGDQVVVAGVARTFIVIGLVPDQVIDRYLGIGGQQCFLGGGGIQGELLLVGLGVVVIDALVIDSVDDDLAFEKRGECGGRDGIGTAVGRVGAGSRLAGIEQLDDELHFFPYTALLQVQKRAGILLGVGGGKARVVGVGEVLDLLGNGDVRVRPGKH